MLARDCPVFVAYVEVLYDLRNIKKQSTEVKEDYRK